MNRAIIRQATLTIVCAAIGFLLVVQFRTHDSITSDVRNLSPEELSGLISRLIEDNAKTQREITELIDQNATYQRTKDAGTSNLDRLVNDLSRLRAQTGAVQVRGAGVLITLDYALQAGDVMALINEIRNAGAEAIAINNQRIVARTVIEQRDATLYINGLAQSPPYQVAALGDSTTLMGALNRLGGLLRIWSDIYEVAVTIAPSDSLTVPRVPPPSFRYAQPAP